MTTKTRMMHFKQVFLFVLCLSLSAGSFQASAQLGKKLKNRINNAIGGGEFNKDKLPGPYFTSNIPLGVFVNGAKPTTQDFYMQVIDGDPHFGTAKGERVACHLKLKSKYTPSLSNGDLLYNTGRYDFYFDVKGDGSSMEEPRGTRVLHLKSEDVYLFYGEGAPDDDERFSNKEGGTSGYIKDHSKIQIFYALAPTTELLTEWNSQKGLERIYAAEDGVKMAYLSKMKDKIADVRMPKPGKMNQNKALLSKVKAQIKAQVEADGATLKRVMITANDWEVVRNKVTGEILYRHIWGYLADSNASRGEIPCMVFGFYYTEKYLGNGKYAEGNGKVDCCSQDAKYGPYIDCANINK